MLKQNNFNSKYDKIKHEWNDSKNNYGLTNKKKKKLETNV